VDGDIFGAVSRLGRDAADGLGRAVAGEPWDPFLAARCLDVLLTKASGLPSLPGVLRQLDLLRAAPLFASALADSAVDAIAREVRTANGTVLDLILCGASTVTFLCSRRSVWRCSIARSSAGGADFWNRWATPAGERRSLCSRRSPERGRRS